MNINITCTLHHKDMWCSVDIGKKGRIYYQLTLFHDENKRPFLQGFPIRELQRGAPDGYRKHQLVALFGGMPSAGG